MVHTKYRYDIDTKTNRGAVFQPNKRTLNVYNNNNNNNNNNKIIICDIYNNMFYARFDFLSSLSLLGAPRKLRVLLESHTVTVV
jgi:hypothetical protein